MWYLQLSAKISIAAYRIARTSLRNNASKEMTRKSHHQNHSKRQKIGSKLLSEGSNEEVLLEDVRQLLASNTAVRAPDEGNVEEGSLKSSKSSYSPPERFAEVEVKITELSSTGDGIGLSSSSDHVYVVPFTVPGDVVSAKVVNYFAQHHYTLTDFVRIIEPSPRRDDALIQCPYFAKCSGCQIQMLPYKQQLAHKKTIIEKAYRNFSTLTPELIPAIQDITGSPLQYGYRTKLTPHFDGPPGNLRRKARRDSSLRKGFEEVPPVGFNLKNTRKTIDIEDCPIGTDAVRLGMKEERKRVVEELAKYSKGATILLRESTIRKPKPESNHEGVRISSLNEEQAEAQQEQTEASPNVPEGREANADDTNGHGSHGNSSPYIEEKTCITDQRATSTEYIDDFVFKNPAGAFFQNNNSILPKFTAYIRNHILPSKSENKTKPIKHLIDAYCGSGLFTITLSSLFFSSIGIDIAGGSIAFAKENANANNVSNASFMTADASALFKEVVFSADETLVVIDPPRKGCDDAFLHQLLQFGPRRVVYVSCNVHTQARDVGTLVEGLGECRYEIESLRGFDFFPQTGHVEGVAILNKSTKARD